MCYLTVSLLDEFTTFLEVTEQIHVGMILNADSLIDKELRKDIFHPEGHIQDVGHLKMRESRKTQMKWLQVRNGSMQQDSKTCISASSV